MGLRIAVSALLLGLVIGARVLASDAGAWREGQKTTRDRVYTKEQATRGAALYVTHCERCHTPEKVPAGKKPGPPVTGSKFMDTWQDHPLGELFGTILDTMPSDGSAVLTPEQALDAVAYLLQMNNFPDGPSPLRNDAAMKAIVFVK